VGLGHPEKSHVDKWLIIRRAAPDGKYVASTNFPLGPVSRHVTHPAGDRAYRIDSTRWEKGVTTAEQPGYTLKKLLLFIILFQTKADFDLFNRFRLVSSTSYTVSGRT
jgi:hypothetical protein